jgi:hypothetical protein
VDSGGKPRIAILSIAHLSDAQRMFFVTTLLSEVLAWMRTQSGTGSLRALVYMDEIFGYFPPSAAPPSKLPMLTLLKQARAFGVGVLLATQNPVDLDYKGLANAGTWFIGRLQTERDKLRCSMGCRARWMRRVTPSTGRRWTAALGLGSRVFLLNDVHEDAPELFQTRWTLSYLRGPWTRSRSSNSPAHGSRRAAAEDGEEHPSRPWLPERGRTTPGPPAGISEAFLPATPGSGALSYRPAILGQARLHYVDKKAAVDAWQSMALLAPVDGSSAQWDEGERASRRRRDATWKRARGGRVVRGTPCGGHQCGRVGGVEEVACRSALPVASAEALPVRRARRGLDRRRVARRVQGAAVPLRSRAARRRRRCAPEEVGAQAADLAERRPAGAEGPRRPAVAGVGPDARYRGDGRNHAAGRVPRPKDAQRDQPQPRADGAAQREPHGEGASDVGSAQQQLETAKKQLADAEAEFQEETEKLESSTAPDALSVVEFTVSPRKSDIAVGNLLLAWTPWRAGSDGVPAPASALD